MDLARRDGGVAVSRSDWLDAMLGSRRESFQGDAVTHLTKSMLVEYEQCEKRFWLSRHRPELAAAALPALFAGGAQLGALARSLVPGGVLIAEMSAEAAVSRTAALLAAEERQPLFEAAFLYQGVLVRTDILIPDEAGWRLAEVKSSSSPKAYQLADLATQVWVARGAGLAISQASIRHVDTQFVYRGNGDYFGLLKDTEVADKLVPFLDSRGDVVRGAQGLIEAAEPNRDVGSHCTAPFPCPFTGHCGAEAVSPGYPVSLLPGAGGKSLAAKLVSKNILDLREAPADLMETPAQARIHEATRTGAPFHDRVAIQTALGTWTWPRYYLDFETIAHLIPPWPGTRPYEQIPFQFSCHVETEDGALEHQCFLDLTGDDPQRACAEAVVACLGTSGSIVTYNQPTEQGCLMRLAEKFPDLGDRLVAITERLVDLLPLVRAHYYHRDMRGSYSIKAVLPAVVPSLSYSDLDGVKDGMAAQAAWLEAVDPATSQSRRETLGEQLHRYCELDTYAMVELARSLSGDGAS